MLLAALGFGQAMKWGTAGMFIEMGKVFSEKFKEIDYPFLIIHDPEDKICSIEGSHAMMKNTATADDSKKLIEGHGFLHGILFNYPEVTCQHAIDWVESLVASRSSSSQLNSL